MDASDQGHLSVEVGAGNSNPPVRVDAVGQTAALLILMAGMLSMAWMMKSKPTRKS